MIETSGLSKEFGKLKAVKNLDLKVNKGLFGLIGPNGSGKTTIIKLLTGQIKPSKGTAKVLGIDVAKDPVKVRELVGIIPEQETPPSFLTADEYLEFVAKVRGCEKDDHWFDLLDFKGEKDVLCKDLSRGTRQKLMFAQAFMHDPKVAFIDEPLINLDPITQRKVKDFLKDYAKRNIIFFSTHVLEIASEICTSIGIIKKGKLIYQGKPKKDLEKFFLKKVK